MPSANIMKVETLNIAVNHITSRHNVIILYTTEYNNGDGYMIKMNKNKLCKILDLNDRFMELANKELVLELYENALNKACLIIKGQKVSLLSCELDFNF